MGRSYFGSETRWDFMMAFGTLLRCLRTFRENGDEEGDEGEGSCAWTAMLAMWLGRGDVEKAAMTLSSLSTCEISDALIKLGSLHGGHIPDIHILSPAASVRIAGPAYTVQMVHASDQTAPKLSAHFVDTATAKSIVVINAPPRSVFLISII